MLVGMQNEQSLFGKQFPLPLLSKDYILEAVLGSQTVSFKVKHSDHMI